MNAGITGLVEAPGQRPQHLIALDRANEVRMERAQLKRDVKAGDKDIRVLVLDPPDYAEAMTIHELLMAIPRYGRWRVNRILNDCRISANRTVGSLTDRQRRQVVGVLAR